jgi:bacteriocin biosynthesis cyclodehydratase domain-containing protein
LPALRRLWRDPHRLQLGTDPERAVLLQLTDARYARVLDLLDGTRTEQAVLREARRYGVAPPEATAILAALTHAGFVRDAHSLWARDLPEATRRRLDSEAAALAMPGPGRAEAPAAVLRRRRKAHVLVTGSSQLAVPIACALASSGIGHLDPDVSGIVRLSDAVPAGLLPSDAHRPRGVAAADAVRRTAPDVELGSFSRGRATFAVLVGFAAPASLTALSLSSRRLDHLAVTVRDGTVVVGPLVRPGHTPCLNCLDLHRLDRDPDWPLVAAQLHTTPDALEPLTATTALAGAAYAAEEVLTNVDGGSPRTLGATVEITGPGQSSRRRWTHHPRCDCQRAKGRRRPVQRAGAVRTDGH